MFLLCAIHPARVLDIFPMLKILVFRNRAAQYVVDIQYALVKQSGALVYHKKHNEERQTETNPTKY